MVTAETDFFLKLNWRWLKALCLVDFPLSVVLLSEQ